MKILGIETSCDETAAAVIESPSDPVDSVKILSNIVASSQELHIKTGGIIPEKAAREQIKSILPVIDEAVAPLRRGYEDLDAIAVTYGPGLIGSLLIGVETAKTISYLWKKPLIPVNHLVGHLYANWLELLLPQFPALGLVVSGGHTDLVLMKNHGKLEWIGGTRDDAAGEAFDKTARLLGLPYPGGPAIAQAAEHLKQKVKDEKLSLFPRPMIKEDNFDFSFSGLKTAVLKETKNKKFEVKDKERLAAEIQEAIVDVLVNKSIRAIKKYRVKSFLLAGGVAANNRLKEKLARLISAENVPVRLHVPRASYCTDNAIFIATAACFNFNKIDWKKIAASPELTIMG